jgi:hypothetical protein
MPLELTRACKAQAAKCKHLLGVNVAGQHAQCFMHEVGFEVMLLPYAFAGRLLQKHLPIVLTRRSTRSSQTTYHQQRRSGGADSPAGTS